MPLRDDTFDPGQTGQIFRLGTLDYLAPPLMAAVVQYMRSTAPGARLLLEPLGPDCNLETALAEGELDLVIGNWPMPPERLPSALLFEDEVVCLVDCAHRCAEQMGIDDYLQGSHVVPGLCNMPQGGVIDMALAEHGMNRVPTVTVPYFSMAPQLLPGTDLIFTTSRHFAEHYAAILPLAVVKPPIDFAPMRFCQLWHPRAQHAAAHVWFRSLLSAVVRTAKATQHTRTASMQSRPQEMRRRIGDRPAG